MPGLLAAEREALGLHRLQDVPVADRRLDQLDALALHRQLEAEVRHHRADDGLLAELAGVPHREGQDGEDLVAVDLLARRVHGEAAVGVAVVRDAQVGAVLDDGGAQQVQVGGAAAVVDVQAVRVRADGDDLGAGPCERLGRDPGGGAVRLVQDDLEAVEPVGQDADEVGDVPVEALRVVGDPADAGAGRAVPRRTGAVLLVDRLDPVLQLVGELVAAAREELDAVVGHRVVAGGEHHADVRAERPGEVRDGGRRQHAHPQHVHPGAGQARHDGGLQELSGCPRITSDHGRRAMAREGARLGEYVRRRDRETERELGRQIGVGDTPYPVRTEESSHWCPPKCSETTNHYCTARTLSIQTTKSDENLQKGTPGGMARPSPRCTTVRPTGPQPRVRSGAAGRRPNHATCRSDERLMPLYACERR